MPEDARTYYRRKALENQQNQARASQNLRDAAAWNARPNGGGYGADSIEASMPSTRNAGDLRGAGTLTKYRPTGGWQTPGPGYEGGKESPGNLRAVAEAVELGSPESYGGGAGAPESIGVIRGLRQTFAPQRQAGQQFIEGEYSTPLRAAQAYNRRLGPEAGGGKFDPIGGPGQRLVAELNDKNPLQKAQAGAITGARMDQFLKEQVTREYGTDVKGEDGTITRVLHPEFVALTQGHLLNSPQDVEKVMKQIGAEAPNVRKIIQYNSPEARKQVEKNYLLMAGPNANPAELERIKSAPITRENLKGFEDIYNFKPQGSGQPSLRKPGDGIGAGMLDQASLLGKTLSYEMQPSLRRAGTPAPTLESVRRDRIAERKRLWDEENLRAGAPSAM